MFPGLIINGDSSEDTGAGVVGVIVSTDAVSQSGSLASLSSGFEVLFDIGTSQGTDFHASGNRGVSTRDSSITGEGVVSLSQLGIASTEEVRASGSFQEVETSMASLESRSVFGVVSETDGFSHSGIVSVVWRST